MHATSPTAPGPYETTQTRQPTSGGPDRFALIVGSQSRVELLPLPEGNTFVLGRGPECDVSLSEGTLSRRHACLRFGDRITVEDLGSKNGTRVQGVRIEPGVLTEVSVGTAFELGAVMFVLQRGFLAGDDAQGAEASARRRIQPRRELPMGGDPIVADRGMRHLHALLDLVAPSPLSILILGETGVGKEVYAREVHKRSSRAEHPFLPIHCAALPESMLEAELFGYERGAFTGAVSAKEGLFETVDGGTVFLDEVGDIPLTTQVKLLRVLETGEVTRLGSVKPRRVDVRFVSATHRDLRELMAAQAFRADLYFRLNGMTVSLPPLRARRADIAALANHWAERATRALRKPPRGLTERAIARLEEYAWPGNVRELRNVIERAVVLARGEKIDLEHLANADAEAFGDEAHPVPSRKVPNDAAAELKHRLRVLERQRFAQALSTTGGNQSQAAKLLGISRYTLMNRMEAFGMMRPRKR